MERTTTKHGPLVDDELENETQSLQRGAPVEARRQQGREKEGAGDDQATPEPDVGGDELTWQGQEIDRGDVRTREEIAQAISDAGFPASRNLLVGVAKETGAADWVVEALERLPVNKSFGTVEAVWEDLGGPEERRF